MEPFVFLWDHWLFLAFLAPFFWALTNLIDVYFVGDVYREPSDGFIISSLFQIAAWLFVPFFLPDFSWPVGHLAVLSLLGGSIFMLSFYFYFKALFTENDVALVQILWTLSVPLVPILSWVFLGERLTLSQYAGIIISFVGAAMLSSGGEVHRDAFRRVGRIMTGAIIALSASMVLQKYIFDATPPSAFWGIYLLFSLGATFPGILVWAQSRNPRIAPLCRKYWGVFFFVESCAFMGYLASERTLSLAPSASFVAVIESLVPAFVMLLSFIFIGLLTFFHVGNSMSKDLYAEQVRRLPLKVLSIAIIAAGICLIA